ncbi:nicotinate-nucleotide--dimethylbenzimidazole phosphoribosyltransferase [Burkholderia perseverans]|uniref:nicotinate-nucleotide--dimethylbenzimidazole phosphoribosyltransferase n=1 Tax=Burkholderia perseverans TaxID=2615214 RepID=UPI001FF02436|nr:nicotinate-nucleotide--dimethylbenzimidazole phosphoribosyltransferase [Burkholderia perseverans]
MNDTYPIPTVDALDDTLTATLQHLIDTRTKPPGSLGRLETLALQLGRIQRSTAPRVARPVTIVFAADHGIAAEGVSPYPQAVTAQMVANFLAGGAAINAFSKVGGCELEIVDAGVATPLPASPALVSVPVAAGTRNFARERAMSDAQLRTALAAGAARVAHHAALGTNVIACGEMGIANTSAAACLMSRFTGLPLAECVGRGTGLDDRGLAHKRAVLEAALARHADARTPLEVLAAFGGFEIAMMTGAFLAAARARMAIVVDGFIASSALLAAAALAPAVRDYCVFSHVSDEAGHRRMLDHLGAAPLLALDLRLGEGTGAALALPLLRAAAAFVNEMASFDAAGVANRDDA